MILQILQILLQNLGTWDTHQHTQSHTLHHAPPHNTSTLTDSQSPSACIGPSVHQSSTNGPIHMPRRSPSGHAFSVPGCNPGDLVFLALVSLPSRLFSVPVHGCSYVSGTCEQSCTETGRQRDAEYLTWTDRDTQGEPAERRLSLRVSVSPGSKSCSFEDSCSFAFLTLLLSVKTFMFIICNLDLSTHPPIVCVCVCDKSLCYVYKIK